MEPQTEVKTGTGADLIAFWNSYAIERGNVNDNTARSLGAASKAVLGIEGGWEDLDITTIDPEDFIHRFQNKQAREYTPKTLHIYAQRFRQALKEYKSYLQNPSSWKLSTTKKVTPTPNKTNKKGRKSTTNQVGSNVINPISPLDTSTQLVTYQYPLRTDCLIQIRLPLDFVQADLDRLHNYLKTLILPTNPPDE